MKPRQEYLHANPFVSQSVGDEQIWGEGEENLYDVPSIHESAFDRLRSDLEQLRYVPQTRLRFVIGPAGSGKSHLFARLRRELMDEHFTFVSVPPQDPSAIRRFILQKVIEGLRHRAREGTRVLNYSQLQRFVYALLRFVGRFKNLSIPQIHRNWGQVQRIKYGELLEEFIQCVHQLPSVNLSLSVTRVLFRALDPEKQVLAVSWLSGSQALTDHDYDALGVGGPVDDNEINDILKNLGKLGRHCGPIILILDQLDTIEKDECIREFEQLTIDLKDHSKYWYIIISLLEEKFPLWSETLSEAFLTRFGELKNQRWNHRLVELSLIDERQQRELVEKRLSYRRLAALRSQDNISNPLYPFEPVHLDAITSKGSTSPRAVLKDAENQYRSVVLGAPTSRTRLSDLVGDVLSGIKDSFTGDEPSVDTASIADRIKDLFDILHFSELGEGITVTDGPLKLAPGKFDGADKEYSSAGSPMFRVVCHDIQKGPAFPNLLRKISDTKPGTILVRDGRVGTAGKVTQQLLQHFKNSQSFYHLSLDEVRGLHALGQFLARMRQGDFRHERTDPDPSETNIFRCLGSVDLVSVMRLSHVFRQMLAGGPPTPAPLPPPQPSTDPPPPSPAGLEAKVQQIMRREGWLCFERLLYRVHLEGVTHVTVDRLAQALAHESLRGALEIHPDDPNFPQCNRILIWVED